MARQAQFLATQTLVQALILVGVVSPACSRPADPAPQEPPHAAPAPAVAAPLSIDLTILDRPVPREWEEPSDAGDRANATIRLGEPVALRLRLTNTSNRELTIYRPDTARGSVGIRLISPGGEAIPFRRPRVGKSRPLLDRIVLAPGQESVLETPLFASTGEDGVERYCFPTQGDWSIDAVFSKGISEPIEVRSAPVSLRVGPPVEKWEEIQKTAIIGLIDNLEPSYAARDAARAQLRSLLGDGPSCYDLWLAPRPTAAQALGVKDGDKAPEAEARRLAAAYINSVDNGNLDAIPGLLAPNFVYNGNLDGAELLKRLGANFKELDPAKLYMVVEGAQFITERPDRVLARIQVLSHDDASGRDVRTFYFMAFEPRDAQWKIAALEIKRSAR